MNFVSTQFLTFFLSIFLIALLLKRFRGPYKVYLLFISFLFYSLWGIQPAILLILTILLSYLLLLIGSIARRKQGKYKPYIFLAIFGNVLSLAIFKYFNFFSDLLYQGLTTLGIETRLSTLEILAPIGISFFTFRIISALVDFLRSDSYKISSAIDFALYVSFFPQISAGPIARISDFVKDLKSKTGYRYNQAEVFTLIASGLLKKLVISSFLFDYINDIFLTPQNASSIDLWIAMFGYSAYILTDFSGYSDLAIALSNLLGFRAPLNFQQPYRATSIQDFWRRWHISLSNWLRDYLYIPLGGSRKGKLKKYINLFLVMFIGGLWHGAGLNFLLWGSMHGVGLMINHFFIELFSAIKIKLPKVFHTILKVPAAVISWIITFLFISLAWVPFNVSIDRTIAFYKGLIEIFNGIELSSTQLLIPQLIIVIVGVIIGNLMGDSLFNLIKRLFSINWFVSCLVGIVLGYVIIQLSPELMPPFIYFQF